MNKYILVLGLIVAMASTVSWGASGDAVAPGDAYEQELLGVVALIEQGKLDEALSTTEDVLTRYQKSRVAYLLKADILRAMSGNLSEFAAGVDQETKEYQDFQHELSNRWSSRRKKVRERYESLFPANVLDMGQHPYLLMAEMSTGRFLIFENQQGRPRLLHDYYMTIGKAGYGKQVEGDNKTPLGLYQVTREIDGAQLPDLYGSGAFPVDYPNRVDRWRKRTGYGIWLHGTPSDTYSRAPLASEGCFVLSNEDYDHIAPLIRQGENMPVMLVESVEWLNAQDHAQRRQSYVAVLNSWAQDWESLDVDRYLHNYDAASFNFGKGDFAQWSNRKRQVGRGKEFIQLAIDINGLFLYPGEKDMFMVDFQQSYLSNNHQSRTSKKQYWRKDELGQWKIVFEG